MRLRLALLALTVPLLAAACGGGDDAEGTTSAATTSASGCVAKEQPAPKSAQDRSAPTAELDAGKRYDITFVTNCGSFTIELDVKTSPKTTASFWALAKDGFFDDTFFHRIVPGFVVQGGDPQGNGLGGPGYTVEDPVPADAKYVHGVVAMAKSASDPPGTSGSQFFVVTGADVGLPPEYAILGKVTKGLDVVDRIGALGGANEQPTEPVVIERTKTEET